ncbi:MULTISPECIES: hypothetical protein [Shewanella]|uniref:Uncharacterized protein n=1 Tax=Shewanella marisflavi TaxID=260364 RepID=A0ABX5WKA1_9GAMM|nr:MULTISPECIES: hypothetical protein [Shewanella]QDF74983.1 hypothetical protein FGA12_07325 [Shewanella marisflavi]
MLTKILVTLLVIAAAIAYLRRSKVEARQPTASQLGQRILFKYIAIGFAALALLGSGGYWYWSWREGNQVVYVTIVSPLQEVEEVYQVRKRDLQGESFTTIDGLKVRLSTQERIVIANTPPNIR